MYIYIIYSDLFKALRIELTSDYLLRMKLKFLLRIDSNEYTKQLAVALAEHKQEGSFTTNIAYDLQLSNYDYDTLLNVAKIAIKQLEISKKTESEVNSNVKKIRDILHTKNRFDYREKLFQILKFETTYYIPKPFKRAYKSTVIEINLEPSTIINTLIVTIFLFKLLKASNVFVSTK